MLEIVISKQFSKDLKLAKKRGLKLQKLQGVIDALAAKQKLEDADQIGRASCRERV